ncbi:MAG: hypothetical protein ACTSRZ_15745 [Promethearchaeota archaeon]
MESGTYEAEFPFIYDDVFLKARVKGNTQTLIVLLKDKNTGKILKEKTLACIHTAVINLPIEDFKEKLNAGTLEEEVLNIRSSEKLSEIHLKPREKFEAFKSWVAGIAEAGRNALRLQYEIEKAAKLQYPISKFLLNSLASFKPDFFYDFLDYIERFCIKEGVKHKPCITANLKLIINDLIPKNIQDQNSFQRYLKENNNYEKILRIISLEPDINLFLETDSCNCSRLILTMEEAIELENFPKLFKHKDQEIRYIVASNPMAIKFEEYKIFFKDKNWEIRQKVALNPNAIKFEEYRSFFTDEKLGVRLMAAININAPRLGDYRILFKDKSIAIKSKAAGNPNAVRFEEYKCLFKDSDWRVRKAVAENPNATEFKEYLYLFNDKYYQVKESIAKNPNATKFKQYEKFFTDKNWNIRREAAANPNAPNFKKYKLLIKDRNWQIRMNVAANLNATKFNEYKRLFKDKYWQVRREVANNPNAKAFKEYNLLKKDKRKY